MKKSIGVSFVALLFIVIFSVLLILSLVYGGIVVFAQGNAGASFWLKAVVAIFGFLFPKMEIFIFIAILASAGGLMASIALMLRISWSRYLFLAVSAGLFIWYAYRLYVIYTTAPMFVSVKAIFGTNPATKFLSLIYFAGAILICAFEVLLLFVLKSLTSKNASLDFSKKAE